MGSVGFSTVTVLGLRAAKPPVLADPLGLPAGKAEQALVPW